MENPKNQSTDETPAQSLPTKPSITEPAPTSQPFVSSSRKRSFVPILVGILLLIIGIGGGVFIYVNFIDKKPVQTPSSQNNQPDTTKQQDATTVNAESTINEIKQKLKGTKVEVKKIDSSISTTGQGGSIAYTPPQAKLEGYEFTTTPKTYVGMSTQGDRALADSEFKTIDEYLTSKGFTKKQLPEIDRSGYIQVEEYQTADIVCSADELNNSSGAVASVSCADTVSFTDAYKELQPLYTAYKDARQDVTNIAFRTDAINKSKTEGYKFASISVASIGGIGGHMALFYQTPDEKWHFFVGTQQMLKCEDYNTSDIRKAFLGEPCFGTNDDNSTVKL